MNKERPETELWKALNLWVPRVFTGLAILFLLYFTQRTYRFSGLWDETFLAEENLRLIRGPWAKKMYYERGLLDYEPKELFPEEDFPPPATSPVRIRKTRSDLREEIEEGSQ